MLQEEHPLRILYTVKLSSKVKEKQTLRDKQKLREFVPSRLQKTHLIKTASVIREIGVPSSPLGAGGGVLTIS